jgi:endo-1,4-beta-mannosidase
VGLFDGHRKWPTEGWDDWPSFGTSGDTLDKAYLSAVVGRWKDEAAILAWDLYNEPDFVGDKEFRWAEHRLNRLGWLARMATEVRRLDRNHLLTIGVALAESNFLPGPGGTRVVDLVDFVSVHYYTRNYPGESLYTVLEGMKKLTRKPIVVEEIGQATLIGGIDMSGDDEMQAGFMSDALDGVQTANVSGMLVWTLYDFPSHANGSEGYYGLVRADDTWKPAAEVFSGLWR